MFNYFMQNRTVSAGKAEQRPFNHIAGWSIYLGARGQRFSSMETFSCEMKFPCSFGSLTTMQESLGKNGQQLHSQHSQEEGTSSLYMHIYRNGFTCIFLSMHMHAHAF